MDRHATTVRLIATARAILAAHHPMTVRQVFYRLVSGQENTRSAYQAISNALVAARREGLIPWAWIEDRLRRPRHVTMWAGLPTFADDAAALGRELVARLVVPAPVVATAEGAPVRPFALGLGKTLVALAVERERTRVRRLIGRYTNSGAYLVALGAPGSQRHGLDGRAVADVWPEHREGARRRIRNGARHDAPHV